MGIKNVYLEQKLQAYRKYNKKIYSIYLLLKSKTKKNKMATQIKVKVPFRMEDKKT